MGQVGSVLQSEKHKTFVLDALNNQSLFSKQKILQLVALERFPKTEKRLALQFVSGRSCDLRVRTNQYASEMAVKVIESDNQTLRLFYGSTLFEIVNIPTDDVKLVSCVKTTSKEGKVYNVFCILLCFMNHYKNFPSFLKFFCLLEEKSATWFSKATRLQLCFRSSVVHNPLTKPIFRRSDDEKLWKLKEEEYRKAVRK